MSLGEVCYILAIILMFAAAFPWPRPSPINLWYCGWGFFVIAFAFGTHILR